MGMFDYLRCEHPLPQRPDWAERFQTKDLECSMATFEITRAGELRHIDRGCFDETSDVPADVTSFTGSVNFYTGHKDCHSSLGPFNGYWVEYVALFRNGCLVAPIDLVKLEEPESPAAVDPHAADPGKPTPRVVESSSNDSLSPTQAPLKELIAKWRAEHARVSGFHATMGTGWAVCADELEAVVSSLSPHPPTSERVEAVLLNMEAFATMKPTPQQTRQKTAREMVELFAQDLRAAISSPHPPSEERTWSKDTITFSCGCKIQVQQGQRLVERGTHCDAHVVGTERWNDDTKWVAPSFSPGTPAKEE